MQLDLVYLGPNFSCIVERIIELELVVPKKARDIMMDGRPGINDYIASVMRKQIELECVSCSLNAERVAFVVWPLKWPHSPGRRIRACNEPITYTQNRRLAYAERCDTRSYV